MKIFVSSIIRDFEQFRISARDAIIAAGMQPVMVEDPRLFPAQRLSPQGVCFQAIDDSDVFVLILGHHYGDLNESGLSAVEEEYWYAIFAEKEIKVFVYSVEMEANQKEFLTHMSNWEGGHFQNKFNSAEDLKSKIIQALSELPESQKKQTKSPSHEGIHDWLVCLKKHTEAQLDRSTMTTPIIGTQWRPEMDKLKSVLANDGKALVTGNSGTGKSGLLNMFVDRELLARRQPVLFINANMLPRSSTSIEVIDSVMPVQTPLAKILRLVSQIMGKCYLVVDQLDSAGGTDLGRMLCGFVKEESAFPGIKVVVASRSYDAKERNEIRTLDFPTVEVRPLTDEATLDMLGKLNIREPSPDLIVLARNFLNLSLIGSLVEKGIIVSDLISEVALWDRFRENIAERESPEVLAKAVYFARGSMKAQEWDFALDIAPDDSTKRLISRGILIRSSGDRYAFFHEEMRSYLYAWDASMRNKALPDTICKELGEVEAFGVLRWMHMMYHEEMPEIELKFVRLLLKPDSGFSFYTRAVCLDVLKKQRSPTPELAKILCSSLKAVEAHSRYFFDQLDNPAWFPHLANQGIFDKTPEPIKTDKGMILPLWEVMGYLIRVASVYADEIAEIVTRTKTENFRIYEQFVKAAIQMPARPAAEIARAALNWLAVPNPFLLVDHCGELTVHLAAGNEWSSAIALCEALIETTVDPVPERMKDNPYFLPNSRFKHDIYEVERFVRDRIPALADIQFEEIIDLLERWLVKTMSLDQREPNYSWWRDAVEDNHQSTGHWECKNILTDTTRDLLLSWSKRDVSRVTPILEKYATHNNSIFRRIALYVIQINKQAYADLAKQLLTNRTLLYDIMIHHEYVNFLSNCFDLLASHQQEQLLTWIMKGPKKRKSESKEKQKLTKNLWIRDRLHMLRENLPQDSVSLLESLTEQYGEPEHPDFLIHTTSRWGSVSPLIQTQVEEMPDDEFIEYLKSFRPSGRGIDGPTSEGLADTIKSAVLTDPARFARIAPRFIDENIISSYVYALLNGFQSAWKEGKDFEWEPVLNCCESLIVRPLNAKEDTGQDLFEEDPVKWVYIPGDIADLLEEGLRRDEHAIPPDYLPRIRELLVRLVEDPHPTLEEEKDSLTSGNMSPAMLSLNCNRGKAMHALINYALRFVRIRKAEEGKDSFVDGRRIEPQVHQVLDDKLDKTKDPSLAIHSIFGWYLPYLFYLDRQWSEESLPRIFPSEQETSEYWEAAWDAYVGYVGRFYTDLYRLLRPQYLRAIINMDQGTLTPSHERPDEKMAVHLMIAYIDDMEKLEDSEGLLVQFYRHAPDRVRAHAVWFLWRSLQEQKPGKGDGLWLKIRHLWEIRIAVASEAQASYDMREELSSYAWLLKDTPENLDDTYALLEPIVPYLEVGTQDRHVLEYLAEQAKVFPTKASLLLLKMAREVPDSIYLSREEPVRQILETANGSVEPEAKENVRKIVNLFGERGDYRYRDLLGRG